jgi:hypothetical protein
MLSGKRASMNPINRFAIAVPLVLAALFLSRPRFASAIAPAGEALARMLDSMDVERHWLAGEKASCRASSIIPGRGRTARSSSSPMRPTSRRLDDAGVGCHAPVTSGATGRPSERPPGPHSTRGASDDGVLCISPRKGIFHESDGQDGLELRRSNPCPCRIFRRFCGVLLADPYTGSFCPAFEH